MKEHTDTPYTTKCLKTKLIQHYGESIVFANIYFHETSNSLLLNFYRRDRDKDDLIEKQRIIVLAADLIKNDIAEIDCDRNEYFFLDELSDITKTNKEEIKVTVGSISDLSIMNQENLAANFDTV